MVIGTFGTTNGKNKKPNGRDVEKEDRKKEKKKKRKKSKKTF